MTLSDHDHCDHDPIECSYNALVGEYRETVAERDRLRTVCDAVGAESIADIVAQRDHLQAVVEGERELRVRLAGARCARDEAIAERDRLRADALVAAELEVELIRATAERDRLRAVVDGDDHLWAHVVMQIMLTIDGGRRTWGDPLAGQVISAVADLETERDRLRAVVDAVRHFIALQVTDDHPPEDDAAAWERMIASLEQLDVSPAMGDADGIPVGYVHRTGGGYAALPPKEQLIDGVNEFELTPNLSTCFGYCAACEMVYPPDQTHHCSDGTPAMGIPERERIVHEDQELRASLERGMGQAAAGEVEGRGDFTRYVAVDPTSPTYDPDQYGTPDTGETER